MKTPASIHTEIVEYQQGGMTLSGLVAYDDSITTKRPGVLIVHQWFGLTDHEKNRARQLAALGYVAFCADIYGKDVHPKNTTETTALVEKFENEKGRTLLRARVNAGLEELKKNKFTDTRKTAAIGFCFGGTTAIELARSGAELNGVVTFHGGLDSPAPADGKKIKCKILALAGADDPFQNPDDLAAFQNEMRAAKVDWQLVFYGGAVHAFTQPDPGFSNPGAKYNEQADRRSWEAMKTFFAEIFK